MPLQNKQHIEISPHPHFNNESATKTLQN